MQSAIGLQILTAAECRIGCLASGDRLINESSLQSAKAYSPISRSDSGRSTERRPVQPKNAYPSMLRSPSGRATEPRELQFSKA